VYQIIIELKGKSEQHVAQSSGKGWLQKLKKGVIFLGKTAGVLLAAPLKLPGKVITVARYMVLVAGIVKVSDNPEADE